MKPQKGKKGLKDMSAIQYALDELVTKPQEKLTKAQAQKILRNCGIMDQSNQIQPAYKKIVVPKDQKKDGASNRKV